MKKSLLLSRVGKTVLFFVAFQQTILAQQPCREIVGYLPNWQWYDRNQLVNPQTIDYSKYTILNYSFFKPTPDGSIIETDAWADENLLKGKNDWINGGYLPNTSVIDLAHNANVKVMVSIGGWTLSEDFPAIAADPTKRAKFASECARLITDYKFDGIDIDWEYPGYETHNGTPADKVNFTLLMKAIRTSIDNLGNQNNQSYLLSAAFSTDPNKADDIEWDEIKNTLDMINLMAYDYFGAWDATSNHNAPLFQSDEGDATFNTDAAFKMLRDQYNVPASQINIGLAFYGRTFKNCTGLFEEHQGTDGGLFWEDEGSPMYYNIDKRMDQFTRYWDDKAKSPYLIGDNGTLVSFDDVESIGIKSEYIVENGARGCIVWEVTGDIIESSEGSGIVGATPLITKVNEVFCDPRLSVKQIEKVSYLKLKSTLISNEINILLSNEFIGKRIVIRNLIGQNMKQVSQLASVLEIDISDFSNGVYLLSLENDKGSLETIKIIKN